MTGRFSPITLGLVVLGVAACVPNAPAPNAMVVRQVWGEAPLGTNGVTTAISPNDRYLVYTGQGRRPRAVYVRDLPAGLDRPLTSIDTTGFVVSTASSPDGSVVGYTWYNGVHDELRQISLDGSAAPRFPYRSDEWPHLALMAWSPDGKQMLLAVKTGPRDRETRHIGLMSLADGSIHIIKTFILLSYFPSLGGISPDGRYVIYDHPAQGDSGERDIFVLGTSGGQEVRLIRRPPDDRYPRFAPDGQGVLFFSRGAPGESFDAWYQRLADGQPQGPPTLLRQDMGATAEPIGFTSNGSFYYHIESESRRMRAVWVMERFLPGATQYPR